MACSHTAISTVGYGEITPRSFLGRLITLPLLLFGLLLIALPSFVLGREFSVVWNEMTNGQTPRTPYTQSGHAFAQSEQVRSIHPPSIFGCLPQRFFLFLLTIRMKMLQSPTFLRRLRARAPSFDGYLHTPTRVTAAATATPRERDRDETHRQLSQSHDMLAAQLAELRAAMDAQSTLLRRMLEREGANESQS